MLNRQLRLALGLLTAAVAVYLPSTGCASRGSGSESKPQISASKTSAPLRDRDRYSSSPEGHPYSGDGQGASDASRVWNVVRTANERLEGDGRLADLASWAAQQRSHRGETPSTIDVDRMSRRFGIVSPFPLLLFVDLDAATWERDLSGALRGQPKSSAHNRAGVYVTDDGLAVVALSASHADIAPVDRRVEEGAPVNLQAKLASGWNSPEWLVTGPDGKVRRMKGMLEQKLMGLPRGTHQIELLARGPNGLEVVANFPIGVGVNPEIEATTLNVDWAPTAEAFLQAANEARAHAGLPPLKRDPELDRIAAGHNDDMHQNHFFAHQSPTNGSTHDRMRRAGFPYPRYGENIGRARSAEEIHTLWMRSPGHRANLLDPNFTHIGLDVDIDDSSSPPIVIATQVFGGG